MPHFTARQHLMAVVTVLVLSLAFHGLMSLGDGSTTARASASSFGAGHTTLLLPMAAR
ncbi:hypothetical protein ACM64Y_01380 [Novispirillum sp. DQ9]|uniref:hypothetical protein n=1 Tax=Novispirillum sp. DQ9 TaxID=3398612 RepID=UPI003C79E932